jgi:sulfur-oxidizing protein SoxA
MREPRLSRVWIMAAILGAGLASAARAEIPAGQRHSGYVEMSRDTRAMQDDDGANPGMLWVLDGEALWTRPDGAVGKSCADCHGDAAQSMKGVAARYPAYDAASGRPLDLQGRINLCHTARQQAPAYPWESHDLLALAAFVGRHSRGMPITAGDDERLRPFIAQGRELFNRREGQLNLACAQCHDDHWDKRLAGNPITQAHPTGYPLYRLEWQGLGSLQRRLRGCMSGVRAEPYPYGAPEYVTLELFLMVRARGLPVETPAVRP